MNPIIQKRYDKAGPRVAAALSRRNMEAFYCPTAIEGVQKVLELIAPEDVVSWGGAMTADEMNLKELLRRRGQLVNIDGNGNRVAALCFGPRRVIVVAGMNKVVGTLDDAIARARHIAAPANLQRFDVKTPCSTTGCCADCVSPQCSCAQIVVTRFSMNPNRIKVVLVGENLGL